MNPLAERLRGWYNAGSREASTSPATLTAEEVTLMAEVDSTTPPFSAATIARFWSKVRKDPDGCWRWLDKPNSDGYGAFGWNVLGRQFRVKAHRYSWMLHIGPIPAGICVCHHCDIPACINPEHLFLGSCAENAKDRNSKNRQARGIHHGNALLTAETVRSIREAAASGTSKASLARSHGLSPGHVCNIVSRRAWTWLE